MKKKQAKLDAERLTDKIRGKTSLIGQNIRAGDPKRQYMNVMYA